MRQRLIHLSHVACARLSLGTGPMEHVVICGFPRSGTTLLQLMLETSYPNSVRFGRERSAMFLAQHTWPGRHELLISKRPNDVFFADEIRASYERRSARTRFLLCTRDPRGVLTSQHPRRSGYYVSVARWRAIFEHFEYVRTFPDALVIEYRHLVERPRDVQQTVSGFIGASPVRDFDEFHTAVPAGFDTGALNGTRPVDEESVDRWQLPVHATRIHELLVKMPELPARLIEMGYEQDSSWLRDYAQSAIFARL